MALVDEVQDRLGDQYLVNLTNPFEPDPTTIDATRLAKAAADVTGHFKNKGITLDVTNDQHVLVAVTGVEAVLKRYNGQDGSLKFWKQYLDDLDQLAKVDPRNRMLPTTDSQLDPSDEVPAGHTRTPEFDEDNLASIKPQPPGARDVRRGRSWEV